MTKRFFLFFVLTVMILIFAIPAQAYTKPFDQIQTEYDAVIQKLKDVNEIYSACDDCIAAFNEQDQEKLDAAYKILTDAGLMPEHYKLKDTSLIEPFLTVYGKYRDAYQADAATLLRCMGFWAANATQLETIYNEAAAGNKEIFPIRNNQRYSSEIIYGFPSDFFEQGKDLSGLMGNIYLIPGKIVEINKEDGYCFIAYEDELYGERWIAVMLPSQYMPSLDYITVDDLPPIEEQMYFCLTFFLKREEDGLKFFYFGADDSIIDDLRLVSTAVNP